MPRIPSRLKKQKQDAKIPVPARLATPRVPQPLKYHGGKYYMAPQIVALMPPHVHYVEPYAGGLAVMLAKDCVGVSEVVNDIDGDLMNFWNVLKEATASVAMRTRLEFTAFSETEWNYACQDLPRDQVMRAWAFFVKCRQSLAGRMEDFATLTKNRIRGGMNEQVSAWLGAIDGLPLVHARLQRVAIRNKPALEVIEEEDSPNTLFYLDPPYREETRSAPKVYRYEMSVRDHYELLLALLSVQGKVMISGYRSQLYEDMLLGWELHTFDVPNNAASGNKKQRKEECLWCNFRQGGMPLTEIETSASPCNDLFS